MKKGITLLFAMTAIFAFATSASFAGPLNSAAPRESGYEMLPIGSVDHANPGNGNVILSNIEWANAGTDFATGSSWVGGTAPANSTTTDVAQFGSQGALAVNPNLGTQRSVLGVSFLAGAYSYNMGGSIITIGASGISDSATNTETFSNGIRTSVSQTWTSNSGASLVFGSTVDINQSAATSRTLTLSGAGTFTFNNTIQNSAAGSTGVLAYNGTGTLNLAHANTFTGGTILSGGTTVATANGAFGTGGVNLNAANVTLTLSGGINPDFINNSATLTIGFASDVVNLNYTGTEIVGGLTVLGVAQGPGIYTSVQFPELVGLGTITVVPEPTTIAMTLFGASLLVGVQRFRRRTR
jgi:autotransporter-associated beta strand protein